MNGLRLDWDHRVRSTVIQFQYTLWEILDWRETGIWKTVLTVRIEKLKEKKKESK